MTKLSRRSFVTAGSLVAASLMVENITVIGMGATKFVRSSSPTLVAGPSVLAVLQVLTEMVRLIGELKKLNRNEVADREIPQLLLTIQQQNTKIIGYLQQTIEMLGNMGVIVRAGVLEGILADIKNTLAAKLDRFYETRRAEIGNRPANRRAREQAPEIYRELYPAFADLGRKLARSEPYGFAHFHTVGQAMLVEMWISGRLELASEFRRQAAKTYIQYFESVLNPKEPGSVMAQHVETENQIGRMKQILESARETSAFVRRKHVRTTNSRTTICDYFVDVTGTISGTSKTGFKYSEQDGSEKRECRSDPDPRGPRERPFRVSEQVPADNGDMSLSGRVDYWNNVIKARDTAEIEAQALMKAIEAARILLDVAKTIERNPQVSS